MRPYTGRLSTNSVYAEMTQVIQLIVQFQVNQLIRHLDDGGLPNRELHPGGRGEES